MKKRLFALAAMLALFVVFCAGAQAAELLDPLKFSNGIAELSASNAGGSWFSRTYKGGKEMQVVFEEYVELLNDRKDLKLRGMLAPENSNIIEMYWYNYTGKEGVSSTRLTINSIDWKADFNVYIRCTENNGEYFITLYAAQEFKLVDSGERASVGAKTSELKPTKKPTTKPTAKVTAKPTKKPTAKPTTKVTTKPTKKPTAKPTAKPTSKPATLVSCSRCGGDGRTEKNCSSCSGSGDMRCGSCGGDGDKDCISCSGKGYDRCSGCGGDGKNNCSSCFGSGKKGDGKRCFSCSGSGDKRCSSCSGSGKKTCSSCRGSGDRRCTNCGGDGKKDCPTCSGRGKKSTVCSTCSGSGKVKK